MADFTFKWLLRIWLQQFALSLLVALCFWWFDPIIAASILVGATVYWLPNMYFAASVVRFRCTTSAREILSGFYRGEVGKFLLSVVSFSVAFVLMKPLDVVVVFITYIALTLIQCRQTAELVKH